MQTLLKGKYLISDPCYIFSDESYEKLLDKTDYFENGELDNCVIYSTDHGDGSYKDNRKNIYGVDSGTIGCFPEYMVEDFDLIKPTLNHYHIFDHDFDCYSSEGILVFGHIKINTN